MSGGSPDRGFPRPWYFTMKTMTKERPPSVERLLALARTDERFAGSGPSSVAEALRVELSRVRDIWRETGERPDNATILGNAADLCRERTHPSMSSVINATGVILHTGLGRAVLCDSALKHIRETAVGHSNLEFDLDTGERGSRNDHVETRLCDLTGAEAALVVNNDAGAVLLALAATCADREVIVSRGELVEIGGGFRIPEVMAQSGAHLVEVGTTNKTRLADYEQAIGPNTAALLTVHPSNFHVVGFTESTEMADIAALAHKHKLPVLDDLGSGALVSVRSAGLADEPSVQDRLSAGADAVMFSGDKLLGGPQAGIIVGSKSVVDPMRRHPLARALRCDKLTLAALEATLIVYQRGAAWEEIPVLRALARTEWELRATAEGLAESIGQCGIATEVRKTEARIGAGSAPGHNLASFAVAVAPEGMGPNQAADMLRHTKPPVIARVEDDRMLLDVRTLLPGEPEKVAGIVTETFSPATHSEEE